MLPRDTNARGTIFGGVILSHLDLAGGIAASRVAARNFVTRAMREVDFIAEPLQSPSRSVLKPSADVIHVTGSRLRRLKLSTSLWMRQENR